MSKLLAISKPLLLIAGGALLLMAIAFYNGYPLYMGDTHAYVTIGFTDIIPFDRSPFYGYFLRHSSLMETLWFTILAQNLVLSFLLLRYYKLLSGGECVRGVAIFFICTVSLTYVSWVMSCLQSDAFTPVVLLSFLLYLFDGTAGRGMQLAYVALGFMAITMHNSHFLIACITGGLLLLYALIRRLAVLARKAMVLVGTGVLYFVVMCSFHAANGYGFMFSRASSLFLVTKFAETGILDKYLDDNCGSKNLKICQYKNEITAYPWEFMFADYSPYAKMGGYDSCKKEFGVIIRDIMTTPAYLKMYVLRSATFTVRQMAELKDTHHILTLPRDSWQRGFVRRYLPADDKEFIRGKQTTGELDNGLANLVNVLFFLFSTIAVLLHARIASAKARRIYVFLLLFYVVNAFVTATGSTVDSRYSYRIFWLLPATNAALLLNYMMAAAGRRREDSRILALKEVASQ